MGKSKYVTIGHRYFMGLHMAICQGPVDKILKVYVAKRSLGVNVVTSSGSATVNKQELFGGDKKEGGIAGIIDFEFGEITQGINPYLASKLGVNTPAFRGTTCLVFRENPFADSVYTSSGGGGFVASMNPYPKPWAVEVLDIPGGTFNAATRVVNGVANGSHIIRDCLTDTDWGLGILPEDIDPVTFTEAGNKLHEEQFGLSILYTEQSTMEDFIIVILNHINAVLYTDRQTGKFKLVLIREEVVQSTSCTFNEINVISLVSFERPSYAEIVNEVTVIYRKRGEFEDTSVTVQDLASVQLQGAVVSQTVQYPGIDDKDLAGRVAQRDLIQLGSPLARVKLVLNREAWDLNPADTFEFQWAAYGIGSMKLRVLELDYGTFESGVVRVTAIEDIFSLPTTSYVDPVDSGWVEETGADAVVAPSERVFELMYHTIQTQFEQADIDALFSDTTFVVTVAELPAIATLSYQLHTRLGANPYVEVASGPFAPTVLLTGILDEVTVAGIPYNSLNGGVGQIIIGGFAYLNDEVLRVDAIDTGAGTVDLGRGFLDSVPVEHAAGSIIYFGDGNQVIDLGFLTVTDVVNAKVLTQTTTDLLDLADAAELTITTVGRRVKPYPPSQVKIEGEYFPAKIFDNTVNVDWKHQDRTQQLVALGGSDWFETSLGSPEAGVLYTVRYYNDDTATLLNTDAGISGLTSSFTPAAGIAFNMRIEIDSIRSGTETNFTTFSHIFLYTKPGTGALIASDSVVIGAGFGISIGNGTLVVDDSVVVAAGTRGSTGLGALATSDSVVVAEGPGLHTGSGSLVVDDAIIIAIGERESTGSGSLVADDVIIVATGEREITGSGALTTDDSIVIGLEFDVIGTGTLVVDDSIVVGSGQRESTGSGSLVADDSIVVGSGGIVNVGNGTLVVDDSIVVGSGQRESTGSGSLVADDSIVVGSGIIGRIGSGSLVVDDSIVTGSGQRESTGSGSLVADDSLVVGAGGGIHTGSGSLVTDDSVVVGTGERESTGSGSLVADDSVVVGTGERESTGSGSLVAADSIVVGSGTVSSAFDDRTLENGDDRTLENGDDRILE